MVVVGRRIRRRLPSVSRCLLRINRRRSLVKLLDILAILLKTLRVAVFPLVYFFGLYSKGCKY